MMDETTRRALRNIGRGFDDLAFARRYNEPLREPTIAGKEQMSGSDQMLSGAFLWHPLIRALWEAERPQTQFMEFGARVRMAIGRP